MRPFVLIFLHLLLWIVATPAVAATTKSNSSIAGRSVDLRVAADPGACGPWLMWPERARGVLVTPPDGPAQLWLPGALPEVGWQTAVLNLPDQSGRMVSQPVEYWRLDGKGRLEFRRSVMAAPSTRPGGALQLRIALRLVWQPDDPAPYEHEAAYACTATAELHGMPSSVTTIDPSALERRWQAFWRHTSLITNDQSRAATAPLQAILPQLDRRDRAEALWRLSRAWFLVGEGLPRDVRKERLATFTRSGDLAAGALKLAPDSGEAAFFVAASTGRYNTTKGLLRTLTGLDEFEEQCQRAIRNGSTYRLLGFTVIGDAHHALGQFYRLVPDSTLAELFLGTRGDIDRSIRHHEASLRAQPNRGDYLKELAVSLLCKASRQQDSDALRRAQQLARQASGPEIVWAFEDPQLDIDHLQSLLQHPDDACSYSRDQYGVD